MKQLGHEADHCPETDAEVNAYLYFTMHLHSVKVKVKQPRYRPGVAETVPGS
jgi:hypothetical protein